MSNKIIGLCLVAACTVNGKAINPFTGGSNPPPPQQPQATGNAPPSSSPQAPQPPPGAAPAASPAPVVAQAGRPRWCGAYDPQGSDAGYDADFDYLFNQYGYSISPRASRSSLTSAWRASSPDLACCRGDSCVMVRHGCLH